MILILRINSSLKHTLTMLPPMEDAAEFGADEDVMGEMRESEDMLEVGVWTEQLLLFPLSLLHPNSAVTTPDDDSD